MVRFFEFNDVGWNISEKCIKDMFLYLDGLHKDMLWAVKCTFRAANRPTSGRNRVNEPILLELFINENAITR